MDLRDNIDNIMQLTEKETMVARQKSKDWFDKDALVRALAVCQSVLLFVPIEGKPLNTKLHGSYKIMEKRGPVNYLLETADRSKKTLLCHINLLRPYIERDNIFDDSAVSTYLIIQNDWDKPTLSKITDSNDSSFVIKHDTNKFNYSNYLTLSQKSDLDKLMFKFKVIFSDNPGRTHLGTHTIFDKPDVQPVKCNAYGMHPDKQTILEAEVQKLVDLGLIRNRASCYASPCLLLNKPDGGYIPVIDYSKLNEQTLYQLFRLVELMTLSTKYDKLNI